ncbi:MAG: glycoside hydrolase family 9 protein [Chloroflexi bacterium]|nr:glycoside hydrolase family 9 protein [Chloroflexota bacterium]
MGAGSRFPLCPQHVVANLSGQQAGTAPILRGAVVNGPNSAKLFADGLDESFDAGHACPTDGKDRFVAFTGHGSQFVDNVSAWQTVESALDFSAIAAYALALTR